MTATERAACYLAWHAAVTRMWQTDDRDETHAAVEVAEWNADRLARDATERADRRTS